MDWNWGLEWARVPQAWNFNDSFEKLDLMRNGSAASKPPVFVVDSGFQRGHPEFHPRPNVIGPNPFTVNHMGHGTHVTGIVASQFTRGRDQNGFGKTEGVDPYCNLHLMTYSRPFSYFSQLKDISWLAYQQSARVINCSYGYSWSSTDASGTRTVISPDSRPEIQSEMNKWSFMAQVTFSGLDAAGKSPFVVIAAGNDAVDSQWAGAMERYSRIIGSNDIIIVGAQAANSTAFQTLSNTNVEIMAPGEFIGSTWPFSTHHALTGTSMAAPHVTGAASYLLHFNPNLTNTQLKFLLSKGNVVGPSSSATPTVLDLFGSMRLMDSVAPPPEMTVEQMLLDVDDGTPDGNLRLRYAPPAGFDPTKQPVPTLYEKEWTTGVTDPGGLAHPDTVSLTRPGDGVIDMSDFRKMRDNIIYFEGSLNNTPHMLDDSPYSMKLDANHNGVVETGIFEDLYSRTDFNGNGGVSRSLTVNGLTDLDILMNSTLWADEYVTSTSVLPQLLDSGDLRIGLTEIIFEFTQDFDAIEIIVSGGGYNHTRQFNATFENGDIDPSILWNFHHQGLLVTLPVGTHTVRINVKRGRNGIPVAFETSVTVGLGEDTFYILQLFDAIQN